MKKKIVFSFILGMLVSGIVVYATGSIKSSDVSYKNTTVDAALDNLFDLVELSKPVDLVSEIWSNDFSKTDPSTTTFTLTQGESIYFSLPAKSEITNAFVKSITIDNSNGKYSYLHFVGTEWGRNNMGNSYNPYILINDDIIYHSTLDGTGGSSWKDTDERSFDFYVDISSYETITVYLRIYTYSDTSARSGGGYINLTKCELSS